MANKAYPEAAKNFSTKPVEPEFTPGDEGCFVTGRNKWSIVEFAKSHGFKISIAKPDMDLSEAATEWLNKFAPQGFNFGYDEGNANWGLYRNDEAWADLEAEFLGESVQAG